MSNVREELLRIHATLELNVGWVSKVTLLHVKVGEIALLKVQFGHVALLHGELWEITLGVRIVVVCRLDGDRCGERSYLSELECRMLVI